MVRANSDCLTRKKEPICSMIGTSGVRISGIAAFACGSNHVLGALDLSVWAFCGNPEKMGLKNSIFKISL